MTRCRSSKRILLSAFLKRDQSTNYGIHISDCRHMDAQMIVDDLSTPVRSPTRLQFDFKKLSLEMMLA